MDLVRYKTFLHDEKRERGIHFTIDHNGVWYFHGPQSPGPMKREALVKLFADKALKYEEGRFFLKTPFESYEVEVEDVPFIIKDYTEEEDQLTLITNLGEKVIPARGRKIFLKNPSFADIDLPYIEVRENMVARLSPMVREDFIERAFTQGEGGATLKRNDILYCKINDTSHPIAKWEE